MPHPAISLALFAAASPALVAVGDPARQPDRASRLDGVLLAQMTIHERVIIRLPRMSPARSPARSGAGAMVRMPAAAAVKYKEKKGPKCVAVTDMGGAQIVAPGAVDLVMTGGKRLRAKLDQDCGPMDFYNGFYLRPAADGKVCADRDVIRMRSGASCGITTFKTLVAR